MMRPPYPKVSTHEEGRTMKYVLAACVVGALVIGPPLYARAADIVPVKADVPAGTYALEKTHASVNFRVSHMGMSRYTARFTKMEAQLVLDPKNPAAAKLSATIDPKSVETDFPLPAPDFDAVLAGPEWLDAGKYPEIKFVSSSVTLTSPNTAKVTGDLTFHGVTKPVTLDVTFNGGYAQLPMPGAPKAAHIGFSAETKIKRSEFGMTAYIPKPGSTIGIGDEVEIMIEAEFTKPNQ